MLVYRALSMKGQKKKSIATIYEPDVKYVRSSFSGVDGEENTLSVGVERATTSSLQSGISDNKANFVGPR